MRVILVDRWKMSASSSHDLEALLCYRHTRRDNGQTSFVNFWSDPREDSSIKLPPYMMDAARLQERQLELALHQIPEMILIQRQMNAALQASFKAWYGNKLPRIYLTEDGKNFVVNVYIYKDHSERVKELAQRQPGAIMLLFSLRTIDVIQINFVKVITGPKVVHDFEESFWNISGCQATGRRAKLDEIRAILFDEPTTDKAAGAAGQEQAQSSGPSIRADQRVMCLGMEDKSKRRTVYHNIIASDHPDSIRLPDLMIKTSQDLDLKVMLALKLIPTAETRRLVSQKVLACLNRLHAREKPTVYVAEKNNRDLVINVPVHKEHIQMLPWSLIRDARSAFCGTITSYYREHILAVSGRSDVEANYDMWPIEREIKFMKPGRVATKDEIHSMFLVKKGEQDLAGIMRKLD